MRSIKNLLSAACILCAASLSYGTPDFLDSFKQHYKVPESSPLQEASCFICHPSSDDYGQFNEYGKAIAQELKAAGKSELTPAILIKLDSLDSNGNGVTNGQEIVAGNNPGEVNVAATTATDEPKAKDESKEKRLIPRNAYHPAIVHFPIALFIAGLVLDFIGLVRRQTSLLLAGWYNMVLAVLSSVAAISSGVVAMQLSGFPMRGVMMQHIIYSLIATMAMWLMVALRVDRHERMKPGIRFIYYVLALVGLITISIAGHLGGELVSGG